jgi:hypothetical protein
MAADITTAQHHDAVSTWRDAAGAHAVLSGLEPR